MPTSTKTLPDLLRPGLTVLSIGINPSLYSVEKGFNFARPGNRFWPVFNTARIVPVTLEPCRESIDRLYNEFGIGFTDIVKRPTRKASELTHEEYRRGARLLLRKIERHQPRLAWFQGKDAWKMFLEHALGVSRKVDTGPQAESIGDTLVFVSPNPSGANPAANPKVLLPHYLEFAKLMKQLKSRPAAKYLENPRERRSMRAGIGCV